MIATFLSLGFFRQSEDLELRQAALYGVGVLAQVAPDATFMPVRDGTGRTCHWLARVIGVTVSVALVLLSTSVSCVKSILEVGMKCGSVFATSCYWYPNG